MRGEYVVSVPRGRCAWELPPRARRIQTLQKISFVYQGTTSACAENTPHPLCRRRYDWNYLRVRGEYSFPTWGDTKARNYLRVRGEYAGAYLFCYQSLELPPRARRIHLATAQLPILRGTTSACAENTTSWKTSTKTPWNYLRVRGEYFVNLHIEDRVV